MALLHQHRVSSDLGTDVLGIDPQGHESMLVVPPSLHPRPVVGDRVATDERSRIVSIDERYGTLSRARSATEPQVIAANLDTIFVVTAPGHDFSPARVERYLIAIRAGGAAAVIILNKRDLCDDPDALLAELAAVAADAPVHGVSAVHDDVEAAFGPYLWPGATIALVGSSGVGKSTLANRLLGFDRFKTGAIRASDGRGRHTSSVRELVALPGGAWLIDTPGMRSFAPWADEGALDDVFVEVAAAAQRCRFRDCTHGAEPGCAVRGEIDDERLERYGKLRAELAYLDRRDDWAAQEDNRRRWRTISKDNKRRARGLE